MAKGGARPGAGRPKGFAALESEKTREAIAKIVVENLEAIVKPQVAKAMDGDTNAFKELMDRAFGKARQNIGLDGGEDGTPVVVQSMKQLSNDELERIATGSN